MPASRLLALSAALAVLGGCATYDDYGQRYPSYQGGGYGRAGVGGSGARDLDPWLRDTRVGQALVLARFDRNYNGEIGADRAREANAWFRRYADRDRDMRLTDREIDDALRRIGSDLRVR